MKEKQENEGLNLGNLRFLVVDDNKHMRTLVKAILHALGVTAVSDAEDSAEGLKLLQHLPPDIVICDWNMMPLDGVDFTRVVRTGDDIADNYVPIIMLTGHTDLKLVAAARDAGVNEFLAKPISAKSLYSRVRSIIEHPRQFIRTLRYFGPDRRRRNDPNYKGPDRRNQSADKGAGEGTKPAGDKELSQAEVEALLNG